MLRTVLAAELIKVYHEDGHRWFIYRCGIAAVLFVTPANRNVGAVLLDTVTLYCKKAGHGQTSLFPSTAYQKPDANPDTNRQDETHALWVDKYKSKSSSEILGNLDAVRKLKRWIIRWEYTFNNSRAIGKSFSSPNGPWLCCQVLQASEVRTILAM